MSHVKQAYETSHAAGAAEPGGSLLGHIRASIAATIVLGILCCGVYPLIVYGIGQLFFPIQANGSLVKKDGSFTTDDTQAVGSALIGQSFSAPQYFHPRPSAAGNAAGAAYSPTGGYDATSSGGTNDGPLNDALINGLTAPAAPPATQADTQPSATAPTAVAAATSSTQPTETLNFDGIRLRTLHYAMDNGITFKLYHIQYDANGNPIASSRTEVPLAKYLKPDGSLNDIALVDAFPHMDMANKQADIAGDFSTPIPADAVTASGSGLDPHISPQNAALQAQRVADARKLPQEKVMDLIQQNTDHPDLGLLGDPAVNVLTLNLALDQLAPVRAPAPTPATTQ